MRPCNPSSSDPIFLITGESMRSLALSLLFTLALCVGAVSQQPSSSMPPPDTSKTKKNKNEPAANAKTPEPAAQSQPTTPPPPAPAAKPEPAKDADKDKEEHYDITEVPAVVTHHQITVDGKLLKYTATAGRLPVKRGDGRIEAEMFFVAYTLDGQEANKRPLTFAFNGGPGSATAWLHMGSLGPKRVALQPDGFLPPAPYHIADNPHTLLDKH